jgi:hypothetical protein
MGAGEKFIPFYGGPFSQWAESPIVIDGVLYNCAEQYMMAKKALLFEDGEAYLAIMATRDPAEQKRIGRTVRGFRREVWDVVSRDVVARASLAKFTSTPKLHRRLMATEGHTLVEASPTDDVWGVKLYENDPAVHDRGLWRGTNWLGQVLTDLREHLQAVRK